ncbi:MAG: Fic family protein [Candidatus Woesearchaeota archaeon]
MVKLVLRSIRGKSYAYLEETIRIYGFVRKISKYIGPYAKLNKKEINEGKEIFKKEVFEKKIKLKIGYLKKKIREFEYPLDSKEVRKIEEMNFKYKEIIKKLHTSNLEDLNKRFIANYVFESNALEGNSLTLKNVAEIVFEKRISKGKDLREIYDAQNSYGVFLFLQRSRKELSHDFIIKIHSMVMEKIDDRLGYRKLPAVLIGKPTTKLTKPGRIFEEMNNLLSWYKKNKNKIYPLELAFKFHAKFEKIHPFSDGNGRVGRFLLNYILMKEGYFPIIIRKNTRNSYLNALEVADKGIRIVLMRFALKHYKETFRKFFEVYYSYTQ